MSRPKTFDVALAVSDALAVFLAKGYEGATLSDLTTAMGINSPSLYAAFGNKMGLFRQAMDLYARRRSPLLDKALSEPTAFTVVTSLLRAYADALTDSQNAPGCLYVQGALSCSDAGLSIRQELADRRLAIEPVLARRFEQAIRDRDLPADADPEALARYMATLLQGMAVQASGGVPRSHLHAMVDTILRYWPGADPVREASARRRHPRGPERKSSGARR